MYFVANHFVLKSETFFFILPVTFVILRITSKLIVTKIPFFHSHGLSISFHFVVCLILLWRNENYYKKNSLLTSFVYNKTQHFSILRLPSRYFEWHGSRLQNSDSNSYTMKNLITLKITWLENDSSGHVVWLEWWNVYCRLTKSTKGRK